MFSISNQVKIKQGYFYGFSAPAIFMECGIHSDVESSLRPFQTLLEITGYTEKVQVSLQLTSDSIIKALHELVFIIANDQHLPMAKDLKIIPKSDGRHTLVFSHLFNQALVELMYLVFNLYAKLSQTNLDSADLDTLKSKYDRDLSKIKQSIDSSLNTFYILGAALRLRIAIARQVMESWSLGIGSKQRVFKSTISDQTPGLSVAVARSKSLTAQLLNQLGYPGAPHVIVKSLADIEHAVQKIGYPLVVKPENQDQGKGVLADLRSLEDVKSAFEQARKLSESVLIEKFQPGNTHRLTVINGQLIKVVKRIPGGVWGDGVHTIRELIEIQSQESVYQRRERRLGKKLLSLDEEALSLLKQNHFTDTSVPKVGDFVKLRRRDNVNAGGTNQAISTDDVHIDNIHLAESIAKQMNMDFIGIDLIIMDISRSWLEIGATICEVNAQPQLSGNSDKQLYESILKNQLDHHGSIPVKLVILDGQNASESFRKKMMNASQALSCLEGVYIDQNRVSQRFDNTFVAAQAAMRNKNVQSLTCLLELKDLMMHGLPVMHDYVDEVWLPQGNSFLTQICETFCIKQEKIHIYD